MNTIHDAGFHTVRSRLIDVRQAYQCDTTPTMTIYIVDHAPTYEVCFSNQGIVCRSVSTLPCIVCCICGCNKNLKDQITADLLFNNGSIDQQCLENSTGKYLC